MPGTLNDLVRRVEERLAGEALRDLADDQLLDRYLRQGDQAAFATLVERHAPLVLSVCRRMLGHGPDADDAFQGTFLVLARRAAAIRWQPCVRGWLYRVALQVARRVRQRAARQRQLDQAAARAESVAPSEEVSWSEGLACLDEELDALPAKYRQVLLACCLEGKSRDEAGEELGLSAGQVKGLLERAREALRLRLARRGVVLPAALLALLLQQVPAHAASGPLLAATTQASLAFAAGQTQAVAPAVLTLAEAVLAGVPVVKSLAAVAAALLVAVVTALGVWAGSREAEPAAPEVTASPPAPKAEAPPTADKVIRDGDTPKPRGEGKEVKEVKDPRKPVQVRGRVEVIDATAGTITLSVPRKEQRGTTETKTLAVAADAVVTIHGRRGDLGEVRPGDGVIVRVRPDPEVAVEVVVPPPEKK